MLACGYGRIGLFGKWTTSPSAPNFFARQAIDRVRFYYGRPDGEPIDPVVTSAIVRQENGYAIAEAAISRHEVFDLVRSILTTPVRVSQFRPARNVWRGATTPSNCDVL